MSRGDRLRAEIAASGSAYAIVRGTSMRPTLRPGEIVRLVEAAEVRPGHIVALEHGGGLLVHRVVRVAADHVVCRGDDRVAHDGLTPYRAIVGRAVEVFGPGRRGGARLRDDAAALGRADLRLRRQRVAAQCQHVAAEVGFLVRQASGGMPAAAGRAHAAKGGEVATDGRRTAGQPDLSAPYALSSHLTSSDRSAVAKEWLKRQPEDVVLTVRALALTPCHRLARAGALARRALARVGVTAGRPGDAVLPGADSAALRPVHLFSRTELVVELETVGMRVVRVTSESHRGVAAWRAAVVRRA